MTLGIAARLDDAGMEHLTRLEVLDELWLSALRGSRIGDRSLEVLSHLRELTSLSVSGESTITEAGIAHVAALRRLRRLSLMDGTLGAAGARELATLPHIESLDLGFVTLGDDGFEELAKMPRLRMLRASVEGISDRGIEAFATARLEVLFLRGRFLEITGPASTFSIEALSKLESLEWLDVSQVSQLTDATIASLRRLPRLKGLAIRWCAGVTPAGIATLAPMPLELLTIHQCTGFAGTEERLGELFPGCRVEVDA